MRSAFSANSPRTISVRSTTRTGTSVQPSCCTARSRRSPAISSPFGVMTIGCRSPSSAMLAASPSMSPRSLRWRSPTKMESTGRVSLVRLLISDLWQGRSPAALSGVAGRESWWSGDDRPARAVAAVAVGRQRQASSARTAWTCLRRDLRASAALRSSARASRALSKSTTWRRWLRSRILRLLVDRLAAGGEPR